MEENLQCVSKAFKYSHPLTHELYFPELKDVHHSVVYNNKVLEAMESSIGILQPFIMEHSFNKLSLEITVKTLILPFFCYAFTFITHLYPFYYLAPQMRLFWRKLCFFFFFTCCSFQIKESISRNL